MTRVIVVTVGVVIVVALAGVATARFFGRSGSRFSILVSVITSWMGAFAVWSFAAGLATMHGFIAADEAGWFALFALACGWWHYRVRLASGRERGLMVFVGAQLVWLLVLLYRNGVLTP